MKHLSINATFRPSRTSSGIQKFHGVLDRPKKDQAAINMFMLACCVWMYVQWNLSIEDTPLGVLYREVD